MCTLVRLSAGQRACPVAHHRVPAVRSAPVHSYYRLAMSVLGKNAEKQTNLVVKTAWTFVAERSVVSSFFLPWSRSLTLSRLGEWNSMKTSLCLQFHEANIAAAATYMALSYLGIVLLLLFYQPNP